MTLRQLARRLAACASSRGPHAAFSCRAPNAMSTTTVLSDRTLLDLLRRAPGGTIAELSEQMGVTATAVRQRLARLMQQGLVQRSARSEGRGRPTHQYALSEAGFRSAGDNYQALAMALWHEVRQIADPTIKQGLLARLAARLAAEGRAHVQGATLAERMESLAVLMQNRDIPFEAQLREEPQSSAEVDRQAGAGDRLPVLTALACPYPDLAAQDRAVCAVEKMALSEALGAPLRLTACRLDGASCCTFEAGPREVES